MCGRYTLTLPLPFVEDHFRLDRLPPHVIEQYRPRYNIAPGQPVLAVIEDNGERCADWFRWGLVPPWAKDSSVGYRMINARSETAASRPAFRNAYRFRRCLLPADGFYEWKREGRRKVPYRFRLKSGEPFALAGLWEVWHPPQGGEPLRSCTILTTAANAVVAPFHDRMPVIVRPDTYDLWLKPGRADSDLRELLRPYPGDEMEVHPVSPEVNSARNDHPGLLNPSPSAG